MGFTCRGGVHLHRVGAHLQGVHLHRVGAHLQGGPQHESTLYPYQNNILFPFFLTKIKKLINVSNYLLKINHIFDKRKYKWRDYEYI
jgi:hypothetical protein